VLYPLEADIRQSEWHVSLKQQLASRLDGQVTSIVLLQAAL
jgi:hypothetical protein